MHALLVFAAAVTPLDDPDQEARAQALEREIRCVVCENEPISQSTADIATDMRIAVRSQIDAGATDAEVRAFFRERYGDFVLLRPSLSPSNWVLWSAPFALLAVGFAAVWSVRRRTLAQEDLTPEEGER